MTLYTVQLYLQLYSLHVITCLRIYFLQFCGKKMEIDQIGSICLEVINFINDKMIYSLDWVSAITSQLSAVT